MEKNGLTQDTELLILASRVHTIYSTATELFPENYATGLAAPTHQTIVTFNAKDITEIIDVLSGKLDRVKILIVSEISPSERILLLHELKAIQQAALAFFDDLRRIRFTSDTRRSVILEGYVPSKERKGFQDAISGYLISEEPVLREKTEGPQIPSRFSNLPVVSLFEDVTLARGFPKYNEIDPTPVAAIMFPLLFGIMFSDLGHGIVLLLLGYFLMKRYQGSYNYWGKLLVVLGAASMITGFIRGEFFGVEFATPFHQFLHFPTVLGGFSISAVFFWLEIFNSNWDVPPRQWIHDILSQQDLLQESTWKPFSSTYPLLCCIPLVSR